MRADRLLSMLLLLQVHGRMTAADLAQRLEVSERTIYRDMDALSAAGVPVYAERGTGGGCFLAEEYRTTLTGLSEPEVRTLFVATSPSLLADLGLKEAAEHASVKLIAALPPVFRRDAEYARQRIYVDAGGWNRRDDVVPFLPVIQDAVWQSRKLHLRYRRSDGTSRERTVDALGLVAKGNIWYLVATVDEQIRTYRVARIEAARVLDEPCVRPPDFDLPSFWKASSAEFRAGLPQYEVVLRVAPHVLERVRLGTRYAHVTGEDGSDEQGWTVVRMLFELEHDARVFALGLGPDAEVIEPRELREHVADAIRHMVALYDDLK
jgi:predicted DNA-binding transcriptional regulator YafY